jgi:hypothetical protein
MTVAPRAGLASFDQIHQIYYTTDDGFARLRPAEETRHDAEHVARLYEVFARFQQFHQHVVPERREQIHLASVIGGLYGLNLIPIFRPREITFFDINPHAIAYFNIVRRVWIDSRTADEFLGRLTNADYAVDPGPEEIIRRCITSKHKGKLSEHEGRSGRSFRGSWRYALDEFDLTRRLLTDVPVHTRAEALNAPSFKDFIASQRNLWIYCSNIFLFSFFDLTFRFPQNAAMFACYFDETDMLDLETAGDDPVTVHCRIPMTIAETQSSPTG